MANLGILDYCVVICVLMGSLIIGLSFGRKKQNSSEYTSGKGKIGVFPVSLSMTATFTSALAIQGIPAEVYLYGPEYMTTIFAFWGCVLAAFTFVPLYFRMDVQTVYEYLEIRFQHRAPRIYGYISGTLMNIGFMGIATFGPAAALESVTGIPTWINILIILGISTIYTSIGGIKAVIWTDVFQAFIMVTGLFTIITVGLIRMGDASILDELMKRDRLRFHVVPDPTDRVNVWILVIAKGFVWLAYYQKQPALMRYRSVGTESRAKIMIVISSIGFMLLTFLSGFAGIVMYAYYSSKECGPLASKKIYSSNQVISYFIADAINFPGVPGLFVGALFAATFSSISSAQNAVAVVLWQDVIQPHVGDVKDATKTLTMKLIVVASGIISIGIAFLAKGLGGSLVQISATLLSVIGGPAFALFIVGGALPFVGAWAAIIGVICGWVLCCFLALGNFVHGNTWERPILITDNCGHNITEIAVMEMSNSTTHSVVLQEDDFWKQVFSVSPFLYNLLAVALAVTVATLLSTIPSFRQRNVKENVLFPFISKLRTMCSENKEEKDQENSSDIINQNSIEGKEREGILLLTKGNTRY